MTERATGPVILKADIKDEIGDGAWVEIQCLENPVAAGNTHRGFWKVYVSHVDASGEVIRKELVTGRRIKPRSFRTIAGLMSFCIELEAPLFVCPLQSGETGIWEFETSKMPAK